jgi:hypothetical protein
VASEDEIGVVELREDSDFDVLPKIANRRFDLEWLAFSAIIVVCDVG